MQNLILFRNKHLISFNAARTYEIALQEAGQFLNGTPFYRLIGNLQRNVFGFCLRVALVRLLYFAILLIQVDVAEEAQKNRRTDNAHDAQRISTRIAVSYLRNSISREERGQNVSCSTQTRRIGNGTVHYAGHHRQIIFILWISTFIKHDKEEAEHH